MLAKKPLWQQVYSPTSSDELTELRSTLAHSPNLAKPLEAYLHAESLVFQSKARIELNPELRAEYQHSANVLVELLGLLFMPAPQKKTTERRVKV